MHVHLLFDYYLSFFSVKTDLNENGLTQMPARGLAMRLNDFEFDVV